MHQPRGNARKGVRNPKREVKGINAKKKVKRQADLKRG